MIIYAFHAGRHDAEWGGLATVSLVYAATDDEPDFMEIDEQLMAQFLGLV